MVTCTFHNEKYRIRFTTGDSYPLHCGFWVRVRVVVVVLGFPANAHITNPVEEEGVFMCSRHDSQPKK